jgi:hypothetical protein
MSTGRWSVDDVLARLQQVRRSAKGWIALCPSHDDQQPSLSIAEGDGGQVLLKCHAGCEYHTIVDALGLLGHPSRPRTAGKRARQRNKQGKQPRPLGEARSIPPDAIANPQTATEGCTLAGYAAAKQLPIEFLRRLGLRDGWYGGRPALRIPYLDARGGEVGVKFRLALTGGSEPRFKWRQGHTPLPYGLDRVASARQAGYITLVEGESDCHTLWYHDESALGLPGADAWREERDAPLLDGIPTIYVVVEPDAGGEAVQRWLARSRLRDRVRLVQLGEHKDPSALYLADPERFREHWRAALEAARPWGEITQGNQRAAAAKAWAQCRALAERPDILGAFAAALEARGVVGEQRAAQLLYLALTSRFLERPVSIAVKGPSSAGKSFLVEQVLACFPAAAYHVLSAMSERALAYSAEPLAHRVLVLYEAAGLQGDFATYLLRSLLSEGRIRYETVEKTRDGLRPRLIEREGPTGLIITTTAAQLHPENETRLLSVTVADSPAQTAAVLRALAAASEDGPRADADAALAPWRALQEWLAAAEHRVHVPFARALAERIPPVAVRLRRDFATLLSLIHAHALLHQATRPRDRDGRIVATLDDYRVVRALVVDLLAEGVDAAVPATVRETVQAVQELGGATADGVPVTAVARRLGLDTSAAWRRVQVALARGYLRNAEPRPRRPARLELGEPLPAEQPLLPEPERLQVCALAAGDDTRSAPLEKQGEPRNGASSTPALASDQTARQEAATAGSNGADGAPPVRERQDGVAPLERALADTLAPRDGHTWAADRTGNGVEEETALWEAV